MLTRRQLFTSLAGLPFIGRFIPLPQLELQVEDVARLFNVPAKLIAPAVTRIVRVPYLDSTGRFGLIEYTREEFDALKASRHADNDFHI